VQEVNRFYLLYTQHGTDSTLSKLVYCLDRLETPHPNFLVAKEKAENEYGGSLEYICLDVCNNIEVNNVFSTIAAQNERLDGLIAAAGINHLQSALEHSQQALDDVMSINFNGVFNSATAAARQMFNYQQKGSILLVASMSGLIANKGMTSPVYNASKAAVIQLSRSLAMEWGRHGIRVNNLCPGHVITPMVHKVFHQNPAARATWEAENMLGRLALPEEFRGTALFCLSDASSFMTGSTLVIDGGHTAW
jgi:NAD(P)-dependent dehydrogenase (short-subunit alcohol dehydrogenase family)